MDAEKGQHTKRMINVAGNPSTTTSISRRCVLSTFTALLFFLLTFNLLQTRRMSSIPSASSDSTLALGFALTPTYGTVSVRNNNGDVIATAKVDGDEQYVQMMRRLSDPSSQHLSPPYGTMGEVIADWPRQALRRARASMGLASSADVGTLAALVQRLLRSIEAEVGHETRYSGAILALPNIISLYEEDACDTLSFLGIHDLVGTHLAELHPRAINAAFIGHGLRNCNDWRDPDSCKRDFRSLPLQKIIQLDYSRGSLSLVLDRLASGMSISTRVTVDFDAGSDSQVDDDERWRQLQQRIYAIVDENQWTSLNGVLLTGESADDEAFQNAVNQAVRKYGTPRIYSNDPVYVASEAASDMAWRAAEIQRLYPDQTYYPCPPT